MVFPVPFPCLSVRKGVSSSSGTACQEVSYLFLLVKAFYLEGTPEKEDLFSIGIAGGC